MKYLIVNADGFGFSEGCNRGIFETIENGITTSASVNMNFAASEQIVVLQNKYPHISIGIHLNPIAGPPVSHHREVKSLLNPETKEFWGGPEFTKRLLSGRISLFELESELSNQLKKALDLGISVTHIDSHQNRHLNPFYFKVFLEVGKKHGITKMRSNNYCLFSKSGKSTVYKYYMINPLRFLYHSFYRICMIRARNYGFNVPDRNLTFSLLEEGAKYILENWIYIFKNLPEGYNELYYHPAYPDDTLSKYASYVAERATERKIGQELILKEIIKKENIKLISFKEL